MELTETLKEASDRIWNESFNRPPGRCIKFATGIQGGIDFLEIEAKMHGLSEEEIRKISYINELKELRDQGYSFPIEFNSCNK
jgi:hypothetical protein